MNPTPARKDVKRSKKAPILDGPDGTTCTFVGAGGVVEKRRIDEDDDLGCLRIDYSGWRDVRDKSKEGEKGSGLERCYC